MRFDDNYGGDPNYANSSLNGISHKGNLGASGFHATKHEEWVGRVCGFTGEATDEGFMHARMFWDVIGKLDG